MSTRLILATRNAGKLAEMRRLLDAAGLDVDLVGTDAYPDVPDVVETEATFAGNAMLKARAMCAATGVPAVADDSGLCVDALNGMPGILSARWAGRHGDDAANLALVLAQMSDVPDARRGAQFRCAAAIAVPDTASGAGAMVERFVEGEVAGRIIREPRGTGGFGYDPIFVPDGLQETFGQVTAEVKDAMSHRGRAMAALVPVLADLLGQA